MLAGLLKNLVDTIIPPRCLLCNKPTLEDGCFCPRCFNTVDFFTPPWNEQQGMPQALASYQEKPLLVKEGLVRCVLHYKNGSRKLIHALKYGDRGDLAPALGQMLYKVGGSLLAESDYLVPVPVPYIRHVQRKYNPSAECAQILEALSSLPILDVLRRKNSFWKDQQITRTRTQRLNNVSQSFFIPEHLKSLIKGATILLIDDVITTGATIATCGRILRQAGAKRVHALALARTIFDGKNKGRSKRPNLRQAGQQTGTQDSSYRPSVV